MRIKVKFYSDPAHGWYAVKRNVLDVLGIADKISMFSYQKGKTVYLEEDADWSTCKDAMTKLGFVTGDIPEKHTDRLSPIRNYFRYMA